MTADSCHKVTLVASLLGDLTSQQQQHSHMQTSPLHLCCFLFSLQDFRLVPSLCPVLLHHCYTLQVVFTPVFSCLLALYSSPGETFRFKKKRKFKEMEKNTRYKSSVQIDLLYFLKSADCGWSTTKMCVYHKRGFRSTTWEQWWYGSQDPLSSSDVDNWW